MVSAEWAVGILAAIAIAGVLLAVVTDGAVQDALLKFILFVINSFSGLMLRPEQLGAVDVRGAVRRHGRGMVTAELAVATLAATAMMIMLCWGDLPGGHAGPLHRRRHRGGSAGRSRGHRRGPAGRAGGAARGGDRR